ncbi:hypothetical protein [Dyadobacter sp. LHD-138]|uniref:hypothetical protein n=1 Tax=Dyadobacter sp. LHD-138 TaxID=3071413 RepID=UPI0027E20753|nr:hypothetical protein [Dyadobacter sp. LHD-138]MDQ6481615.1 hypothetical protein [Dyadobacter sp. LHD-138]
MTTRFKNAVDSLVSDFFKDELTKGSCSKCALGRIVAHSFNQNNITDVPVDFWKEAFVTSERIQTVNIKYFDHEFLLKTVESTQYSIEEMMRIEYAFESNTQISWDLMANKSSNEILKDRYNGLMAVVEILCEIDGIENATDFKQMFSLQ